jgi:hypothetical protein
MLIKGGTELVKRIFLMAMLNQIVERHAVRLTFQEEFCSQKGSLKGKSISLLSNSQHCRLTKPLQYKLTSSKPRPFLPKNP